MACSRSAVLPVNRLRVLEHRDHECRRGRIGRVAGDGLLAEREGARVEPTGLQVAVDSGHGD